VQQWLRSAPCGPDVAWRLLQLRPGVVGAWRHDAGPRCVARRLERPLVWQQQPCATISTFRASTITLGSHGLIRQHVYVDVVLTAAATAASSQRRVRSSTRVTSAPNRSAYSSASDCCDPYSHDCRMSRQNACLSMWRSARYLNDVVTGDGGGGTPRRQVTRWWSEQQTDCTVTSDINWPRGVSWWLSTARCRHRASAIWHADVERAVWWRQQLDCPGRSSRQSRGSHRQRWTWSQAWRVGPQIRQLFGKYWCDSARRPIDADDDERRRTSTDDPQKELLELAVVTDVDRCCPEGVAGGWHQDRHHGAR